MYFRVHNVKYHFKPTEECKFCCYPSLRLYPSIIDKSSLVTIIICNKCRRLVENNNKEEIRQRQRS